MRRNLVFVFLVASVLGSSSFAVAGETAKPPPPAAAPDQKETLAERFKEAREKWEAAQEEFLKEKQQAHSKHSQKDYLETASKESGIKESLAAPLLALVAENPADPAAEEVLEWAVEEGGPVNLAAIDLLAEHFPQSRAAAELSPFFDLLPSAEARLRAVLRFNTHKEWRPGVLIALAQHLVDEANKLRVVDPLQAEARLREAETLAEEGLKLAQALSTRKLSGFDRLPSLKQDIEEARDLLADLQKFGIDQAADEIEGEDSQGKRFKLSDYRGKVVVLKFWASWCAPCMATMPHAQELVKKMEGKPFAYLGVNFDKSKKDLKEVEESLKLSWRSWWDGYDGPIGKAWPIHGVPAIYILDGNGVIRFKNVQGQAMDEAVEQLLAELAQK